MKIKNGQLKIFYDGQCPFCHREIKHYFTIDRNKLFIPINIKAPDFNSNDYNFNFNDLNKHIHSIDENGKIYKGVDTFIEIWSRLPYWKYIVPIIKAPIIYSCALFFYDIFAQYIRPRLPKRDCSGSSCNIL